MSSELQRLERRIPLAELAESFNRQINNILVPDGTASEEDPLSDAELASARLDIPCQEILLNMASHIVAGVDYGAELSHFVLLAYIPEIDREVIVFCDEIPLHRQLFNRRDVDCIADHVETFKIQTIVDDANGLGTDRHRIVQQLCPQIPVLGGFFDTGAYSRKGHELFSPRRDGSAITIAKAAAVSQVLTAFRNGKLLIREDLGGIADVVHHHLQAMYITPRARGRYDAIQPSVEHVHGEDHFFSALLYARLALWSLTHES